MLLFTGQLGQRDITRYRPTQDEYVWMENNMTIVYFLLGICLGFRLAQGLMYLLRKRK